MLLSINYPSWLSPEIIRGLPFRWYGLMYLVAFAVSYAAQRKHIRERNFPMTEDQLSGLYFWAILGLLLGARIFSTLVYEPTDIYRTQPWLVFWPFHNGRFTGLQGMSYHGGVIGCILGFELWAVKNKYDLRDIGDLFATGIPLGYTFGRIGNFINGELYGRVTTAPWGMIFPNAERLNPSQAWVREVAEQTGVAIPSVRGIEQLVNLPRHPSQLYEAFFEGVFLWFLIWLVRNKKPFRGSLFAMYIGGYGIVRFFIEYFREPDSDLKYRLQLVPNNLPLAQAHPLTSFSTGQVFCFIMVVAALIGFIVSAFLPNNKPIHFYPKEGEAPAPEIDKHKTRNKNRSLRKKLK
ncbi:MAG: prolipoprotein diacylglyceryl transferase [Termitinemataceae bacterium]|nr:MAG: prolipoprotein diacylglyceryl transferase [Termitinemataceae bacterium]